MKVFLLEHSEAYESGTTYGIFSTKQKAKEVKERMSKNQSISDVYILEVDLDVIVEEQFMDKPWLTGYTTEKTLKQYNTWHPDRKAKRIKV